MVSGIRYAPAMAVLSRRTSESELLRERTRDGIVRATVRLLDAGTPFTGLTVGAIATAAGVSRPTFYAYFRDKRDLILALGADFDAHTHDAAAGWLTLDDDDLRGALEAVLRVFATHRSAVRAVVEAAGYDEEVARFWRAFHERFIVSVVDRATRADPTVDREAAHARAFALVWMTERSFVEHLEAPRVTDAALLDAVEGLWRSAVPSASVRPR